MIKIVKGTEPEGLKRLRDRVLAEGISEERAYRRLRNPLKDQVRQSLVNEQGGLCAYCMCRIPRTDAGPSIAPITIEHFIPRNPSDGRSVGQALDYSNLLAVCHGNKVSGRNRVAADLTCDAHRGNTAFRKVNPLDEETLMTIYYDINGKIFAGDEDVNFDLVDTLNLNCDTAPLAEERRNALETLIHEIGETEEDLRVYCETLLEGFESETDVRTPYVGILIWYLKDFLAMLSGLL